MGKPAAKRRLDETEARASLRGLRTSPRKLNLVAETIRGKTAASALAELTFCHRRVARDVKKVLQAAIANAENNHKAKLSALVIESVLIGPGPTLKRSRPRAKGSATPNPAVHLGRVSGGAARRAPKRRLNRSWQLPAGRD